MSSDVKQSQWLSDWDPENEKTWDSKLAWRTLTISTLSLILCFVTWFLPSAIVPKLNDLGFGFSQGQLYWLAAIPGLSGGLLRIVWMVLPPILGTRKMVGSTMFVLLLPIVGWGFAVQSTDTPYWALMALAFLAGIGGGAFSGFMPSTSYFFPKSKQGTALGLQAGIGNFGVSLVQLLTPWFVGLSLFGIMGASQTIRESDGSEAQVWYQNAAFVYIPLIIAAGIWAFRALKSVPVKADIRQQFDIFKNQDTWWMTILYIMTFGTFAGLSAQFGLLMNNLYGAGNSDIVRDGVSLIENYSTPDVVKYVFLGPLVGAGTRVLFAPLTDRMGGARWTLVSGILTFFAILYTIPSLTPDTSSAEALQAGFNQFLFGMLLIFFTTGIGNASTFKQMPMIFERRQAGGVIGWTAAIGAFGPFFFGLGLTITGVVAFYIIGAVWAVGCVALTWWRYARPGAPKPS